jgi:hypothetical protein
LTPRRPDQFCSVDQRSFGKLTRRNLAVLAEERGETAEAVELWVKVFEERPSDPEAIARLEWLGQRTWAMASMPNEAKRGRSLFFGRTCHHAAMRMAGHSRPLRRAAMPPSTRRTSKKESGIFVGQ